MSKPEYIIPAVFQEGSGSQYTVCVSLAWWLNVHRVIIGRITICYGHTIPNLYKIEQKNIVHGENISLCLSTFTYEHLQM